MFIGLYPIESYDGGLEVIESDTKEGVMEALKEELRFRSEGVWEYVYIFKVSEKYRAKKVVTFEIEKE